MPSHQKETGKVEDITKVTVYIFPVACSLHFKEFKFSFFNRFWAVYPSGFQQFEAAFGTERYAVDLLQRSCGCRGWQLTGYPCVHGMAAIASLNLNPEDYVHSCYSKASFLKCYAYTIHPLNDSSMWPTSDYFVPLPPKRRRLPGRPTIKRKRGTSEREISGRGRYTSHQVSKARQVQKCSICKLTGHKKSRCPSQRSARQEAGPSQ